MNTFSAGSLVKARGREWVVLPESKQDRLLHCLPGGADKGAQRNLCVAQSLRVFVVGGYKTDLICGYQRHLRPILRSGGLSHRQAQGHGTASSARSGR